MVSGSTESSRVGRQRAAAAAAGVASPRARISKRATVNNTARGWQASLRSTSAKTTRFDAADEDGKTLPVPKPVRATKTRTRKASPRGIEQRHAKENIYKTRSGNTSFLTTSAGADMTNLSNINMADDTNNSATAGSTLCGDISSCASLFGSESINKGTDESPSTPSEPVVLQISLKQLLHNGRDEGCTKKHSNRKRKQYHNTSVVSSELCNCGCACPRCRPEGVQNTCAKCGKEVFVLDSDDVVASRTREMMSVAHLLNDD